MGRGIGYGRGHIMTGRGRRTCSFELTTTNNPCAEAVAGVKNNRIATTETNGRRMATSPDQAELRSQKFRLSRSERRLSRPVNGYPIIMDSRRRGNSLHWQKVGKNPSSGITIPGMCGEFMAASRWGGTPTGRPRAGMPGLHRLNCLSSSSRVKTSAVGRPWGQWWASSTR